MMRVLVALTIWLTLLLFPQICSADSGIIVKESLWRHIAEDNQVAVIKIDEKGHVDVSLFISIVDKSGKSNTIHLVLPFRDRPISFQAQELTLADFRKHHVEAITMREQEIKFTRLRAQEVINNCFRIALALGFPSGLLMERAFLPPSPKEAPPRLTLGGIQTITPELVITTEHTRTEVYRVSQETDVEQLLKGTGISQEQIERLKRQLVGRHLYLVTAKTVPLKSEQQSHAGSRTYSQPILEEERLGVVFHVRLEAQRNGHELTFTYPLGTGETWWHPISFTELFILTPPDGSLELRFPKLDSSNQLSPTGGRFASWQRTFVGRDEVGHVARLTYINANPNEDVIVKFDPKKPSKIPTITTTEKVGRIAWLFFLALLLALWFPSFLLFRNLTTHRSIPIGSFLRGALTIGFWLGVFNGFFGLIAYASLQEISHANILFRIRSPWLWRESELVLFFSLIFAFAILLVIASLPSMRPHRTKLLGIIFGVLLVPLIALFPPAVVVLLGLPVSSLVIYLGLNHEGEPLLTYWRCLSFLLLFGFLFFATSLAVRSTLLAFVNVSL